MSCPCFMEDYFGACLADGLPYAPSIAQMEQYCFNAAFKSCPIFKSLFSGME